MYVLRFFYATQRNTPKTQKANMNLWGIPIQGVYLPFAYLALAVLMGNYYMDLIHGVAIGHVYYFLADVVPQLHGKDILQTPQFLIDRFGVGEYQPEPVRPAPPAGGGPQIRGFGQAQAPPAQQQPQQGGGGGGRYNWGGTGRPLGRD